MAYKSLEIKRLSQRMRCTNRLLWHTNSDFYGIRTPPFMPYEPFLLGVGVVFNLLIFRIHKTFVRDSGAGHGCANFMGAWNFSFFLQENLHVHKIPRFRGGHFGFLAGGG